jgi:hypothetical protein
VHILKNADVAILKARSSHVALARVASRREAEAAGREPSPADATVGTRSASAVLKMAATGIPADCVSDATGLVGCTAVTDCGASGATLGGVGGNEGGVLGRGSEGDDGGNEQLVHD